MLDGWILSEPGQMSSVQSNVKCLYVGCFMNHAYAARALAVGKLASTDEVFHSARVTDNFLKFETGALPDCPNCRL